MRWILCAVGCVAALAWSVSHAGGPGPVEPRPDAAPAFGAPNSLLTQEVADALLVRLEVAASTAGRGDTLR